MSQKQPNEGIRCRVKSCSYHCDGADCCSLECIQVEPRRDCHNGNCADESMCASYECCK